MVSGSASRFGFGSGLGRMPLHLLADGARFRGEGEDEDEGEGEGEGEGGGEGVTSSPTEPMATSTARTYAIHSRMPTAATLKAKPKFSS